MSSRDIRVCFVGDSFIAGRGDSSGLGWVGRFTAQASRAGIDLTGYNLGIRCDTSVDVSTRIAAEIAPRLTKNSERRVVISFGVNDTVRDGGSRRVALTTSVAALSQAVEAVAGIPLAIVGPPAIGPGSQNDEVGELSAALQNRAAELDTTFIDVFSELHGHPQWRLECAAGDGVHPDSAGYERLFHIVSDPLHAWLLDPYPDDRPEVIRRA